MWLLCQISIQCVDSVPTAVQLRLLLDFRHPREFQPEGIAMLLIQEEYRDEDVEQASGEGAGSVFSPAHRTPGSGRPVDFR